MARDSVRIVLPAETSSDQRSFGLSRAARNWARTLRSSSQTTSDCVGHLPPALPDAAGDRVGCGVDTHEYPESVFLKGSSRWDCAFGVLKIRVGLRTLGETELSFPLRALMAVTGQPSSVPDGWTLDKEGRAIGEHVRLARVDEGVLVETFKRTSAGLRYPADPFSLIPEAVVSRIA